VIDLAGTVALVTGAGRGIGADIARRFVAAGAAVVVHHRTSSAGADALVEELTATGGRAVAATADVTDADACAELMATAVERFGRLDAVVANAGVQPVADLASMTMEQWRAVVDTNLAGAFATVRAAADVLRDHGSVTLIASIEGSAPARGHAHYAASKAGVIMLARAAALEYGPAGIRVNAVSPGLVAREGIEHDWPDGVRRWRLAAPLGRLGSGADVGNACVFLASPLAQWITGHNLVVDGGVSAAPSW
jgi:glucose 1-dehydrogenase